MLHQKSKRQGKTKHALAKKKTCTTQIARARSRTLLHAHAHAHTHNHNHMLHFTSQPPPSLSASPAKTSTACETCLETERRLPPLRDWLSNLATAYARPASQARCERHTDPMRQIIQRRGQAQ